MGRNLIRRNDVTTFAETHRSNMHGWTDVHWTCQTCHVNYSNLQKSELVTIQLYRRYFVSPTFKPQEDTNLQVMLHQGMVDNTPYTQALLMRICIFIADIT